MALALPFSLPSAPLQAVSRSAPFRRLAVLDPPYEGSYEVLIAMAPPLARGTVAKVLLVPTDPAEDEAVLMRQVHDKALRVIASRRLHMSLPLVALAGSTTASRDRVDDGHAATVCGSKVLVPSPTDPETRSTQGDLL